MAYPQDQPALTFLTRWVGIRKTQQPPVAPWLTYVWAFIGSFCGLAVVQAVFGQSEYFISRGVPLIVASYGASAVLAFGVIESPLAQPRAVLGGHFLSALVGLIVREIFNIKNLDESGPTPRLSWLASSLATSIAIVVMQLTKTTHPPAGATALLPIVDASINNLGWYLLPVVLLSSTLLVAVALITNNIQRRYPTFWLWPAPPKKNPEPPVLPKTEEPKAPQVSSV